MNITRRKFVRLSGGLGATLGLGWQPLAADDRAFISKPIPSSGELIPAIGIGTNRYSVGDEAENALLRETISTFSQHGGRVVDTAPMYRSSEKVLGQVIAEINLRDELFLATKADRDADEGGRERLEESFRNLRTDKLDLVQSHSLRGVETMLPVLQEYREAGRIRYVGITTSRNEQFDDVLDWMAKASLDFVQVNYSLANREAAEKILPLAQDEGIAVLANIPLARGQLFKAVGDRPLPGWALDLGCESWAQVFLKYVISHPAVTCAIPGMTKARHVIDNLGAASGLLPGPAERRQIEQFFDSL
jgi:aryl-alcohol dehydrogenase-like predicted oxidoreductase